MSFLELTKKRFSCKKIFNLLEDETPVLLLDLGYTDNMGPLPPHENKKPLKDTVIKND